MKKIKLLSFIILISLVGNTQAAILSRKDSGSDLYSFSYTVNGNGHGYGEATNYMTDEGVEKKAYCINPGRSAAFNKDVYKKNTAIFDKNKSVETDEDLVVQAYGAGVATILSNGENDYVTALAALRAYMNIWKNYDEIYDLPVEEYYSENNGSYSRHMYYVYKDIANKAVFGSNGLSSKISSLSSACSSKVKSSLCLFNTSPVQNKYKELEFVLTNINSTEANTIASNVRNYVSSGIDSAIAFLNSGKNGAAGGSLSEGTEVASDEKSKTIEHTLDMTNLDTSKIKSGDVTLSFECENCTNVKTSFKVNNQSVTNLSSYNFAKSEKFTIDVILVSNDTANCKTVNYTLKLKFKNAEASNAADSVYEYVYSSNSTEYQKLYVLTNSSETMVNKTVKLCSKDTNGCTTFVSATSCDLSSDNDEIVIKEGVLASSGECATASDPVNALKCVVEGEDLAGNSYLETDLLSGNPYCQVYCKEEYKMMMPGLQDTNSGRYFSLKMGLEGSKTCYTSQIDKENKFSTDIENLKKEVLRAYNNWIFLRTMVDTSFSNIIEHTYCSSKSSCVATGSIEKGDYNSCGSGCECTSRGNCTTAKKLLTYTSYNVNTNAPVYHNNDSYSFGYYSSANCGGSGSCTSYTTDYNRNNYESQLTTATGKLKSAIQDYVKAINYYNSCGGTKVTTYDTSFSSKSSSGWKMDYTYDTKVEYSYDEVYMGLIKDNSMELVGNSMSNMSEQKCTGTSNDYTDCSAGWTSGSTETAKKLFTCKVNGNSFECGSYSFNLNQSKFVKQEMNVKADYKTPTIFYTVYPSGGIVLKEYTINDTNLSELTDSLPVALDSEKGTHGYGIKISNLGEYYNKNTLGRIWGDKNSTVTVATSSSCNNASGSLEKGYNGNIKRLDDGAYVCGYNVNCPDCPPVCEEDCERCSPSGCPPICENCIYDKDIKVKYRPISTKDINPTNRELGVNWNISTINTAMSLKASAAIAEIEESGETVYDTENETNYTAMTFKLNANAINFIKKYNNEHDFLENDLICYDYKNSSENKTYSNIFCYSTFIDELVTKKYVTVDGKRLSSEDERKTSEANGSNQNGYWTTWTDYATSNNKWNTNTTIGINSTIANYGTMGIGPSYK